MVGWDSKPTPYHHGYPKRSRWWPDSEGDWHDSDWREGGWQTCANPEPKENKDKDLKASAAWEEKALGLDSKPAPYHQGYKKEKKLRSQYRERKKGDWHDSEGREGGCKIDAIPDADPDQDKKVDDEWSNEPAWKARADRVRKMAYESGRSLMEDNSYEQRMVSQQDEVEEQPDEVEEADAPKKTSGPSHADSQCVDGSHAPVTLLTMAEVKQSLSAEKARKDAEEEKRPQQKNRQLGQEESLTMARKVWRGSAEKARKDAEEEKRQQQKTRQLGQEESLTKAEVHGSLAAQMARKEAEEVKRQQQKERHFGQEESSTRKPRGSLARQVARREPAIDTDSPHDEDSPVPSNELTVPSLSEDETGEKGLTRLSELKSIMSKAKKKSRWDQRPTPEVAPETKPWKDDDDANIDEEPSRSRNPTSSSSNENGGTTLQDLFDPEKFPEKECDKDIDDDNLEHCSRSRSPTSTASSEQESKIERAEAMRARRKGGQWW